MFAASSWALRMASWRSASVQMVSVMPSPAGAALEAAALVAASEAEGEEAGVVPEQPAISAAVPRASEACRSLRM